MSWYCLLNKQTLDHNGCSVKYIITQGLDASGFYPQQTAQLLDRMADLSLKAWQKAGKRKWDIHEEQLDEEDRERGGVFVKMFRREYTSQSDMDLARKTLRVLCGPDYCFKQKREGFVLATDDGILDSAFAGAGLKFEGPTPPDRRQNA